jgi:hypothetical protein
MVIVRFIWHKLCNVERNFILIVRNFWQLFSQIIGETELAFAKFATTLHLEYIKSVYHLVLVVELIYDILLTNEMVNITTAFL